VEARYANLFAYRVSTVELVLEFGNFFHGQDNRSQAGFADFDTRVVMSADLLEQVIQMLEQAKQSRNLQREQLAMFQTSMPAKGTKK
jgi:hypothetical protein